MPRRLRLLPASLLLALVVFLPAAAGAETAAIDTARGLISRYDLDPTRIDRARDVLEGALARDRQVETMVLLSRVYFLLGDVRAATEREKLDAYGRGRELGQRAIELAPRSEDAHVWYAINTGRWGQTKGVLRSLFLLPTLREELETIFSLNPRSIRGHALAGNLDFTVPALAGGDRERAESHFVKGLEIDPHYTVLRVDFARLLIAGRRWDEARRQLTRVVEETAPTSIADWTARDLPRARALLEEIKERR